MTLLRPIPLIVAAMLLAAGAVAAAYVVAPERFRTAPPPEPAPPPAPVVEAPRDPLGRLSDSATELLVRPGPDAPSPFLRIATLDPDAFCKALPSVGLTGPVFHGSEPPQRGWSCASDVVKPVAGDEGSVSSLFFAARGAENDRISSIRIKLNLIDPATAPQTQALAQSALAGVFAAFRWTVPESVTAMLASLTDGKVEDLGIIYDLKKEFGDSQRYNFTIDFPEPAGPAEEDRFTRSRR